jgi:hypothetical protein
MLLCHIDPFSPEQEVPLWEINLETAPTTGEMCDLKGSMLKVKQNILYTEHKVY